MVSEFSSSNPFPNVDIVLEHSSAEGRYIIALDPKGSSLSLPEIAKLLLKEYPSFPIATRKFPGE